MGFRRITFRAFAAYLFLLIVVTNGALELYVSALAAERAGIRIIPSWLRLESPLCIPTYFESRTVKQCECKRARIAKNSAMGIAMTTPQGGEGVPISGLMFPVPDSLSFKFLFRELTLPTARWIESIVGWRPQDNRPLVTLAALPETPPPRA
jgi:hypothetical protein